MKRTVICEYVGIGHPDKAADQISDVLLDAFMEKDPNTCAGIYSNDTEKHRIIQ